MTQKTLDALTDLVLSSFPALTADERLELLSRIGRKYCLHCGHPQPPECKTQPLRQCQCWNDV